MPFLDLAMKSLLVRLFSSTNRNLTLSAGQSLQQLKKDFADMRNTFHSRYVRLYGACDREGFYDDVIEAAWHTSLGVHALIWVSLRATCMPISPYSFESQFGFDGTDQWVARRDRLFRTLHSNPKAKFVTRVVQFGSEPLFDHVLSPDELAAQVLSAKKRLSGLDIPVTVSELAYGYQANGGAQNVLDAIDSINIHMLPFFSSKASTGKASPSNLLSDRHSASHRSKRLAPGSQ
jgi:exo-beta-1,3-glucanase (GH17 family)